MADINIRIGANISDLQKKLRQAESSLSRSGKNLKSIGSSLTMSLSAPLALFGGTALKVAGDFEASMNGMKAVTAGADDLFKELEATAKRLGATTQFSATEAAAGMEMLGKNGLTAQQILDGAAESSLMLAAATGTDLANAANIATDAMAQFGMEASQLSTAADIITGATVNSKFGIDDFQGAMAQAGGVAGAVGVSFDDFATTVSAISPAFASGSDAGTSLKTMLTRLIPESKAASDMMQQLGIITADGANRFFDAEGNMKSMSDVAGILNTAFKDLSEAQKINAAKTLFGTDAMRAGLKLADTGAESYDKLKESLLGVSATGVAETRMEGFNGAILRLKSAFETLQLAIADSGIQEFATMLIEKITGIMLRVSEMNPQILQSATLIAGMAAAIGPLIYAFGMLQTLKASMIGTLDSLLDMYKKYINVGLNAVLFAENRAIVMQNLKTRATAIYNSVLNASIAVLKIFKAETYKNMAATVASTAAKIANSTAQLAINAATFVAVGLINAVIAAETAYVGIKNLLTGKIKLAAAAQAAFNAVLLLNPIGLVIGLIGLLVVAFVSAYQNIEGFRNFIDKAMAFIKDKVMVAVEKIKNFFLNLPAYLNAAAAAMAQFVQNVANAFKRLVLRTKKFMKRFAKALTIDKDKRAALEKEIQKIASDEKLLEDNAKSVADVFNERLKEGIENGEQLDPQKIKEGIGGALEGVMGMLGMNTPTGGGYVMPEAPKVETNTDEIDKEYEALRKRNDELAETATTLESLHPIQSQTDVLNKAMATSANSLAHSQAKVTEHFSQGYLAAEHYIDTLDKFNESLTNLAYSGLEDLAVSLGESIGAMATGQGNLQTLAAGMLGTIGGVLEQLGKLAIQTGVALLSIEIALKSLNPAIAIAGGIALLALASVVKSKASSLGETGQAKLPAFANGGLVTSPTLGMFGEAGPEALIPKKRLDSLLARAESGGYGEGMLTTRISGNDLEIVLDKTRRRNNRVR